MVYDPTYSNDIAEGNASSRTVSIKQTVRDPLPTFVRMIVLDVVSDTSIIDDNKIDYWNHILKVSNIKFAKILPRNTIIGQRINTGSTQVYQPIFLFPFFPSHLAMPCKPGEMIWATFENPNARVKEIGYWFCRITEPNFVDDVNHTHHAMQLDHSFLTTSKQKFDGNDDPFYELRNGKTNRTKDGVRFTVPGSGIIPSEDDSVFENLITKSDASYTTQYEPVPRFKKRPGDIALEGSNNSLIVLGTDRTGPVASYNSSRIDQYGGLVPNTTDQDLKGNAGSIDMVVGRGMTEKTGGKVASTTSIKVKGYELKKEIGKSEKEVVANEGDPDLKNDRSRVLISQRTSVDGNFGLSDYTTTQGIVDTKGGDSAVVIKSDKVRIIARSDISFIVTNFKPIPEIPNQGKSSWKEDDNDKTKWASITIKTNGDIIFSPSEEGVIKLGGVDADKGLLCTNLPAINEPAGTVTSPPIGTTGGGFVGVGGEGPDFGKIATKILVK